MFKKFLLSVFFGSVLFACGNNDLVLEKFGPTETQSGVAFNTQPDGGSAFWTVAKNATRTSVLMFDDIKLVSAPDNKSVNALVPKELYSIPGQHEIYIYDPLSGKKSNKLIFTVK